MIKLLFALSLLMGSGETTHFQQANKIEFNDNIQNALSYPSGYDYAYTYNGGVGTYEWCVVGNYCQYSIYTRSGISGAYDYDYNITGAYVPFRMYHYFEDSNTSWTSYAGGYVPTAEYVGSTSGFDPNKVSLTFENDTPNVYKWALDVSTSSSVYYYHDTYLYSGGVQGAQIVDNYQYVVASNIYEVLIMPYSKTYFYSAPTSSKVVLSAYYIDDLSDDIIADTIFDEIYDNGYGVGYDDGLEDGYANANTMNDATNGLFDIMYNVFNGVGAVFSIQILPSITIGMIVAIPVIFALLLFVLKMFRGGS